MRMENDGHVRMMINWSLTGSPGINWGCKSEHLENERDYLGALDAMN
jgi:hypothetical protein